MVKTPKGVPSGTPMEVFNTSRDGKKYVRGSYNAWVFTREEHCCVIFKCARFHSVFQQGPLMCYASEEDFLLAIHILIDHTDMRGRIRPRRLLARRAFENHLKMLTYEANEFFVMAMEDYGYGYEGQHQCRCEQYTDPGLVGERVGCDTVQIT